jgi:hypothetical protein
MATTFCAWLILHGIETASIERRAVEVFLITSLQVEHSAKADRLKPPGIITNLRYSDRRLVRRP